jgi:CHAT domain-containing protein
VVTLAPSYGDRTKHRELAAKYDTASSALSRKLLGPIARSIGTKKVVIVSSGILQNVPFAALFVPGDRGERRRPLGVRNQLTALYSISSLDELRQAHVSLPIPKKSVAVFADPVMDGLDLRVSTARSASPKTMPYPPLGRLSFTREEALRILQLARPGMAYQALGFQANRANLTRPGLDNYRFVHIAAHALFLNPALPSLVLSRVNERGDPLDGMISAPEIYGLRLASDLVSVPDCGTGLGREVGGEGPASLARAFLFAGSRRVLASLWSPDDEATSELMIMMYDSLLGKQHASPGAALQLARRKLWDKGGRWRDPYYSAGFVLYGEYR